MAGRRGTRYVRRATVSGDTTTLRDIITNPSGVTFHAGNKRLTLTTLSATSISCTGVTATWLGGKVNFGQGTAYKIYFGTCPVSQNDPVGGTGLSNGTIQIATGLTTLNQFLCTFRSSAVSSGQHGYPHYIHWTRGYKTAGGVTVFLSTQHIGLAYAGCTPVQMAKLGGCSLDWTAIGV